MYVWPYIVLFQKVIGFGKFYIFGFIWLSPPFGSLSGGITCTSRIKLPRSDVMINPFEPDYLKDQIARCVITFI